MEFEEQKGGTEWFRLGSSTVQSQKQKSKTEHESFFV